MRLLKIGRDNACDIVLNSPHVSSLHAELVLLDSGDMELEDKGSKNGTFVMNQPIAPGKAIKVNRGDAIRFGDTELQWSQVPMPEDNSAYKALWGIGTNLKNDLQLSGATVSRYHATVKLGRDGKMYIVDHSKNGTTVNGQKITAHNPYRIRRKDAIVCGGVPVDTSGLPWPTDVLGTILKVAATVIIVCGVGLAAYKLIPWQTKNRTYTDVELNAMYRNTVALVRGACHYEVSFSLGSGTGSMHFLAIPKTAYYVNRINSIMEEQSTIRQIELDELLKIINYGQLDYIFLGADRYSDLKDFVDVFRYTGTAFFVSEDGKEEGKMVTNLHVVKPWLFGTEVKQLQDALKIAYGNGYSLLNVEVHGKLDDLIIVPQGNIYSSENWLRCRVLSAGEDPKKDVALVQVEKTRDLPAGISYVNVTDSLEANEKCLEPGSRVYTIGFPTGMNYDGLIQDSENLKGIQAIGNGGQISQVDKEFDFMYNAVTTGGASGSPVFNEHGMLIGVHHAGLSRLETQGYNTGIKAKYVKELLDGPYKK